MLKPIIEKQAFGIDRSVGLANRENFKVSLRKENYHMRFDSKRLFLNNPDYVKTDV